MIVTLASSAVAGCSLLVSLDDLRVGPLPVLDGSLADAEAPAPDASTNCSADLQRDPENCGACGHGCAGGACAMGRCEPITLVDVPGRRIYGVVSTKQELFFTVQRTAAEDGGVDPGGLFAATLDGSAPRLIVGGLYDPRALQTDGNNLYVATGDGRVRRTLLDGRDVRSVNATNLDVVWTCLALSPASDTVYASSLEGDVVRRMLPDGEAPVAAVIDGVSGIAFGEGAFHWLTAAGTLYRGEPDGGGARTVLSGTELDARCLVEAGGFLYWVRTASGTIRRMAVDDPARAETLAEDEGRPISIWVDERFVYWTTLSKVRRLAR